MKIKQLILMNASEEALKQFAEKSILSGEIEVNNIGDKYRNIDLYVIERLEEETTEILVEIIIDEKVELVECMGKMIILTHIIQFHILKKEDADWIIYNSK